MHQFRITKYDPARRDAKGAFLDDVWTDASEIGKNVGGKTLDLETYLSVETAYVDAALMLFERAGLDHLRVTNLDSANDIESLRELQRRQPDLDDREFSRCVFQEDQRVDADLIAMRMRRNLRNAGWCKLEVDRQFFIHTGWDFYLYVGCAASCEDLIPDIRARALFVEPFASP